MKTSEYNQPRNAMPVNDSHLACNQLLDLLNSSYEAYRRIVTNETYPELDHSFMKIIETRKDFSAEIKNLMESMGFKIDKRTGAITADSFPSRDPEANQASDFKEIDAALLDKYSEIIKEVTFPSQVKQLALKQREVINSQVLDIGSFIK